MMTSQPVSETELQLYRVLQRANLLQYYDTFISQGGDDVRQLCEAGEEEFLEIMALVGMASKPLHVRRLQKALQEWVQNPDLFKQPLNLKSNLPTPAPPQGSIMASIQRVLHYSAAHTPPSGQSHTQGALSASASSTEGVSYTPPSQAWVQQQVQDVLRQSSPATAVDQSRCLAVSISPSNIPTTVDRLVDSLPPLAPAPIPASTSIAASASASPYKSPSPSLLYTVPGLSTSSAHSPTGHQMAPSPSPPPSHMTHPALSENQLAALVKSAEKIASEMPQYELRPLNLKKAWCRGVQELLRLPDDHPDRMAKMRQYGAIYGRFDSKRKPVKPMSLHELCVNEAAAQLCYHCPALLTRRNDLFPLARDVVRESGYQYSKGHSRGQPVDIPVARKRKAEDPFDPYIAKRHPELTSKILKQEEQLLSLGREITEVEEQQVALQPKLDEARAQNEEASMRSIEATLMVLRTRLKKLLMDQSVQREILCTMKSVRKPKLQYEYPQSPNSGGDHSHRDMDSEDDSMHASGYTSTPVSSPGDGSANISAPKDSLVFGEGLRIAEQYGMSDFAAEIAGLNKPPEEAEKHAAAATGVAGANSKELSHPMSNDSGVESEGITVKCESTQEQEEGWNEQEEWNREVEKDMHELSETSADPTVDPAADPTADPTV